MAQPPVKKKHPDDRTSDMVGLPKHVTERNKAAVANASTGPKYKETKITLGPKLAESFKKRESKPTPLKQKKIVEKGSYEKGKVEKYPSKKAMVKHEKKETKSFEKGESKKPSPMKYKPGGTTVKTTGSTKTGPTIVPKQTAAIAPAKSKFVNPSPVRQKSPAKMKKC